MISQAFKFIYLHIPKTGGTSIWKSLELIVPDLTYVGHGTDKWLPYKNSHFVFTSIRNPWDLTVSNYFYLRKDKTFWNSSDGSTQYGPRPDHSLVKNLSFNEFVHALAEGRITDKHVTTSQHKWVNKFNIDYFIRFENFTSDLRAVCKKISLPSPSILKLNSTDHAPYQEYYTPELVELVGEFYKRDIELFSYEFKR